MRLSHRRDLDRTHQINGRTTSGLDGLRCCCLIALADALVEEQVEHRVGQAFTSPCCGKRLVHREGVWELDSGVGNA